MIQNIRGAAVLGCPADFSPAATLTSGQCFRWTAAEDGGLRGIVDGITVRLTCEDGNITVEGDDSPEAETRWRHYLDLDTDYAAIREETLRLEPRLCDAAERCGGVRILNQQPWEAFCSFIISQNNNIPRIRLIISRLCELCGVPALGGGFAFPSAQTVAGLTVPQLEGIGAGYRAEYILGAARLVADGTLDLEALRTMPLDGAYKTLLAVKGVGMKVADCTLLYGLHRLECFPRDVWIKRALAGEFKDTPLLGTPFAGVAQQYIFEYIRGQGK